MFNGDKMRKLLMILIIVCVIFHVNSAGQAARAASQAPNVVVELVDSSSKWSLLKGVHYVATFSLSNIGNAVGRNVYLNAGPDQTNPDAPENAMNTIYVGDIAPGKSKTVSLVLDRNPNDSYLISYGVSPE